MARDVRELDDGAMQRIAADVRKRMVNEYGPAVELWLRVNARYVEGFVRFTWLATREEIDR
jgi:hypothetical protein